MSLTDTFIDIEKVVLGSLIIDPLTQGSFQSKLSPDIFHERDNQIIFQAIQRIWEKRKPVDIVILTNELENSGNKDLVMSAINLTQLVASTAHLEYHIMILVERQVRKDFQIKFSKILKLVDDTDEDIFEIRDKAIEYFESLFLERFSDTNMQTPAFPELINSVQKSFEALDGNSTPGLMSSLDIINKTFGGWHKSDLVILAGRPGMGKTAFMVQQIVDISTQKKAVGVFSLEMSSEQIAGRIINNYTGIPNSSTLRKGLSQTEKENFYQLKPNLITLGIHIDDTPGISIQNLRLKAKMMKIRFDIEILFVDYIQLITYDTAKNREQEIGKISRNLKALAKELNIPIIALSQLSRAVEHRPNKRPFLSDLRDSGSIEQDADEVIFLYRPEYYGIDTWVEYNFASTQNEIEIIVSKNRHGGTLSERCKVNLATSKFKNIPDSY